MTATTALTAQNTQGVYDIHHTPPSFVKKQIDACIDDIGVDVIKTGMLASADTVLVVANAIKAHKVRNAVIDPVMVSTSGAQLLPSEAVRTLLDELLPVTTILTPNLPEAQLLLRETGRSTELFEAPKSTEDLIAMAKALQKLGPKYVLLKGGHLPLTKDDKISTSDADHFTVFNVLVSSSEEVEVIVNNYQRSKNTHGTGCSLACKLCSSRFPR